jgi:ABC-type branched-subunit amino acid transport system substrate-binding protein
VLIQEGPNEPSTHYQLVPLAFVFPPVLSRSPMPTVAIAEPQRLPMTKAASTSERMDAAPIELPFVSVLPRFTRQFASMFAMFETAVQAR